LSCQRWPSWSAVLVRSAKRPEPGGGAAQVGRRAEHDRVRGVQGGPHRLVRVLDAQQIHLDPGRLAGASGHRRSLALALLG
jgi:hypothetical protein